MNPPASFTPTESFPAALTVQPASGGVYSPQTDPSDARIYTSDFKYKVWELGNSVGLVQTAVQTGNPMKLSIPPELARRKLYCAIRANGGDNIQYGLIGSIVWSYRGQVVYRLPFEYNKVIADPALNGGTGFVQNGVGVNFDTPPQSAVVLEDAITLNTNYTVTPFSVAPSKHLVTADTVEIVVDRLAVSGATYTLALLFLGVKSEFPLS